MNKRKSFISILVIVAILMTCFSSTFAQDNQKMTIELKIGSSSGKVNGHASQVEKPYITNNTIMVPLAWVLTAIGAEINQKSNSKIDIIYRELNAEIIIGSKNYTANLESKKLDVAPIIKNSRTMVPLDFIIKNFPVSVTTDKKKGNIKIILEDDGALSDLSFLTGGISSKKIGNSFYGWSVSIPSGSRIAANNYKSSKITIANDSRSLYIDINVENKNNRTLAKLYDTAALNNSIRESKIDLEAKIPYFQYTSYSIFTGSSLIKVFDKGEYFYTITLTSDSGLITPEKLLSDKFYQGISSSFDLSYKGNVKGVEDISKVRDGKASFYNYVMLGDTSKYLTWSMDMPIKWENRTSIADPMNTVISLDNRNYIKITTNTLNEGISLEQYVDEVKNHYDEYFNKKVYSFIDSDVTTVAGLDAQKLRFTLNYGKIVYHVEELYLVKDGFVYEISIYLQEKDYDNLLSEVTNALDEMTLYTTSKQKYQQDLEEYYSRLSGIRLSEQDDIYNYVNKSYKWTADIPGYWTKFILYDDSEITFKNKDTSSSITITAINNEGDYENQNFEEEFGMDEVEQLYEVKPVITELNDKGFKIKNYTYRIEKEEYGLFETMTFKVFEKSNYIYCFKSEIFDLNATEKTIAENNKIWESFNTTD